MYSCKTLVILDLPRSSRNLIEPNLTLRKIDEWKTQEKILHQTLFTQLLQYSCRSYVEYKRLNNIRVNTVYNVIIMKQEDFWLNNEFKFLKIDENSDLIKHFSLKLDSIDKNPQYKQLRDKRDIQIAESVRKKYESSGYTNELGVYSFAVPRDELKLDRKYIKFLKDNNICEILLMIKTCLDDIYKDFLILDQIYSQNEINKTIQPEKLSSNSILPHPLIYNYYCLLIKNIYLNLYKLFDISCYRTDAHFKSLINKLQGLKNTKINVIFTNQDKTKRIVKIKQSFDSLKTYLNEAKILIIDSYVYENMHTWATKIEKHLTLETGKIKIDLPPIKELFNLFTITYKTIYWEIVKSLFCLSNDWKLIEEQKAELFDNIDNFSYITSETIFVSMDKWIPNIDNIWKKGNYVEWINRNLSNLQFIVDKDNQFSYKDIYPQLENKYKFDLKQFYPFSDQQNVVKFKQQLIKTLNNIIFDKSVKTNIDFVYLLINWLSKNSS